MSRLQLLCCATLLFVFCACGPVDSVPDAGATTPGIRDAGNHSPDAGHDQADAGHDPQPVQLTIQGQLLGDDGLPPDHTLSVVISGLSPVSSSSDGTFQIAGVTAPYDVTVIDGANNSAITYQQVSRRDPTLLLPSSLRATSGQATLSGRVSGGQFPQQANQRTVLLLSSELRGWYDWSDSEGSYAINNVQWAGGDTLSSRLIALQFELDAAQLPARFIGFASKQMTLSNGATFTNNDLGMVSVTNGTLSGSMGVPAGYAIGGRSLWLQFGAATLYFPDRSTSDGFSYVTPVLPEGHAVMVGSAVKGNSVGYHYKPLSGFGGSGVRLEVQAPPEPLLPTEGATAVDSSIDFSWSPYAQGAHLVTYFPVEVEGPVLYVVTRQSSTRLPDLAAYGMSLPSGAAYAWSVEGFAPLTSMDEAASPAFAAQWRNAYPEDFHWGTSLSRGFTTR